MVAILDILINYPDANIPPMGQIMFLAGIFAAFCIFVLMTDKGSKNDP